MKLREAWRASKPERKTISARDYYLNLWYAMYTVAFLATVAIAIFFGPWWALFPATFGGYCIGRHECYIVARANTLEEAEKHDSS